MYGRSNLVMRIYLCNDVARDFPMVSQRADSLGQGVERTTVILSCLIVTFEVCIKKTVILFSTLKCENCFPQ